jgi:hypothetical protein
MWPELRLCGVVVFADHACHDRVGAKNAATLCDLGILVNQPAESVSPDDLDGGVDRLG